MFNLDISKQCVLKAVFLSWGLIGLVVASKANDDSYPIHRIGVDFVKPKALYELEPLDLEDTEKRYIFVGHQSSNEIWVTRAFEVVGGNVVELTQMKRSMVFNDGGLRLHFEDGRRLETPSGFDPNHDGPSLKRVGQSRLKLNEVDITASTLKDLGLEPYIEETFFEEKKEEKPKRNEAEAFTDLSENNDAVLLNIINADYGKKKKIEEALARLAAEKKSFAFTYNDGDRTDYFYIVVESMTVLVDSRESAEMLIAALKEEDKQLAAKINIVSSIDVTTKEQEAADLFADRGTLTKAELMAASLEEKVYRLEDWWQKYLQFDGSGINLSEFNNVQRPVVMGALRKMLMVFVNQRYHLLETLISGLRSTDELAGLGRDRARVTYDEEKRALRERAIETPLYQKLAKPLEDASMFLFFSLVALDDEEAKFIILDSLSVLEGYPLLEVMESNQQGEFSEFWLDRFIAGLREADGAPYENMNTEAERTGWRAHHVSAAFENLNARFRSQAWYPVPNGIFM